MSRDVRGMTLLETLVGSLVAVTVLAAMSALLSAAVQTWRRAGASAEARDALAEALDQLDRDVRLAGYDPAASGFAGIVTATAQTLELQADLDGNGIADTDSEEHVTYRCTGDGQTLERVVGRQVMPLVSGLVPGTFNLRYFDDRGHELVPTDANARAAIRSVTVRATTRAGPAPTTLELTSGARPLNR